MPLINGTITVTFQSNYAGSHTVNYTVVNAIPASGSETVTCGLGTCSVDIPISYECPDCVTIEVEGTILADCTEDETLAVPFGPVSFNLNQGCQTYRFECLSSSGCLPLQIPGICPECPQWNNSSCNQSLQYPFDQIGNGAVWDSYVYSGGLNPNPVNDIDSIIKGAVFKLCLTTEMYQNIMATSNIDNYGVSLVDEDQGCCWDCEQLTFVFDKTKIFATPAQGGTYVAGLTPYPTIYYTDCSAGRECAQDPPGNVVGTSVKCFRANTYILTETSPALVTLCVRKNSYTVLNATTNYTVSLPSVCSIPPQYSCD